MWFKEYRDYPIDLPLKKEPLEPNRGFNGCEMHEPNGWGTSYDLPREKAKNNIFGRIWKRFFP